MRKSAAMLAPLFALVALSGCNKPPAVYVDQAYVRLSPNADSPSAGYFTMHAGDDPITLRGVLSDDAIRVEMHENMVMKGMTSMMPVDHVDIPAKAAVAFAPGGRHLMLWGINPSVVASGKLTLTLLFSNGDRLLVDAPIQKAGAPLPAPKK